MQHCCRSGRGSVCFGSPAVEWKERNQAAKTDQQHEENVSLGFGRNLPGQSFKSAHIEGTRIRGKALVQHDQPDQENETAQAEIDCNFPCCGSAISAAPNSNQKKGRDQSELVKGIKKEQIERSERANCSAGNQKKADVKRAFVSLDCSSKPNRRDSHDRPE